MPLYPNVPLAPGVPPVLRNPLAAFSMVALLAADAVSILSTLFVERWGIFFPDGTPAVVPDTVATLDYKQGWQISDYPVEQGAFQSYNKVQLPFQVTVRMAVGGSSADRQSFLFNIAAIAGTLDLYDVVTPEAVYRSANIVSYDYRRAAHSGAGLLVVDVRLVEVRVTATAQFTNATQTPSGASPVATGQVNPGTPTPQQQNSAPLVQ